MEFLYLAVALWVLIPAWAVFSRRTIDGQQNALREARAYEYAKANREYKRLQKESDARIKRLLRDETIITSTIEKMVERANEKALKKISKKESN